jgi:Ca2+-transporting ATPase
MDMRLEKHQHANKWHLLELEEVLGQLEVNPERGLTDIEVAQRKGEYGLNQLAENENELGTKDSLIVPWKHWMAPVVTFLILVAIGFVLLGEAENVIPIVMIIALNVLFVITQVYRTEQASVALREKARLKKMIAPVVRVRRDGQSRSIPACELVPGDIVFLETGNRVVADGRLLESANLCVQEASLTGESHPVDKTPQVIKGEGGLLGDRHNMVFMGTAVTGGRGTAVVVATGMGTELGRIIKLNPER